MNAKTPELNPYSDLCLFVQGQGPVRWLIHAWLKGQVEWWYSMNAW